MVSALEGWREDYGQVLREIDSAALLRDEEPLQRLSAVYARLLVQRSQFVIVSEDIRARCSAQSAWAEVGLGGRRGQVPSELHLTAAQVARAWEKQMQRTKRKAPRHA